MNQLRTRVRERRKLLVVSCLAIVAACSEATAPKTLEVAISMKPVRPPDLLTWDGDPIIACMVELQALASGSGTATWESATFRFSAGKDRSDVFDSATVSATDVAEAWTTPTISAGERWPSIWTFRAGVPFTVTATFRYLPKGASKSASATTSFDCGPTASAGTTPPAVTNVTVLPTGPVEPGQLITVGYTATSNVGLWMSAIELSGGCDTVLVQSEWLATNAAHSVDIRLPSSCTVGAQLDVTVYLLDAVLQEGSQRGPSLTLADRTPPQISVAILPANGASSTTLANGEYFVEQSLPLAFLVSDNLGLRMLTWEVLPLGVRDSLPLVGKSTGHTVMIPLPASSVGTQQVRAWVRDAGGNESAVFVSPAGAVRVLPTTIRPRYSVAISGSTDDLLIDPRRSMIYVRQQGESRIAFVSMSAQAVTRTVALPSQPMDFDFSASGDSLIVTAFGSAALHVIDLTNPAAPVTTIGLTLNSSANQAARAIRVMSNGKAFVGVSGSTTESYGILEVQLSTGAQRMRTELMPGFAAERMARSESRNRLAIEALGGLHRYDVATDQFGPRRSFGPEGYQPALSANGEVVAFGPYVLNGELNLVREIRAPGGALLGPRTALSPGGDTLYTATGAAGVVRSRVSDGATIDRIPAPLQTWLNFRVSGDGNFIAYSPNSGGSSNSVGWIDLR